MNFYKLWNQINEAAEHFIAPLFDALRKNSDPDLWVHFTEGVRSPVFRQTGASPEQVSKVPKIGIRPIPTHNDPIGVYAFPKSYILAGKINENPHFFNMQFAYIIKLRPGLRTLSLNKMTPQLIQTIFAKLGIKSLAKDGESFWQELKNHMMEKDGFLSHQFFKPLGIDAIYDEEGIIHYNEKHQILILDPKGYSVVEMIDLKTAVDRNKQLATKLLNAVAKNFFDSFQFSSSKYYSERTIGARGIYKGQKAKIWVKYYPENSLFSGKVDLTYELGKNRLSDQYEEKFYINHEDVLDVEQKGAQIAQKYKDLFEKEVFNEPKAEELKKLTEQIAKIFGLTKMPQQGDEHESFSISRNYKLGSLLLNIYHSYYDNDYKLVLVIKVGESVFSGTKIQVSGNSVRSEPNDAKGMVEEALKEVEQAIYTHYNPDPDKHTGSTKYEWAERGRKLITFLEFLKNRIYKEKE